MSADRVVLPGGAVSLNFLTRIAKAAGAIAVTGVTAYGIAGCSHTTTLAASSATSSAAPAAEPGVTTYLCRFTSGELLLQWNASNGYISGTYQDATISGTAPQEQVNTSQGNLSGTAGGSGGITLHIGTDTWYGNVSGSSVTLNVPQTGGSIQPVTCAQAGVSDWNSAVSQLNGQVTSDDNTALQQQAQASSAAARQQAQQQHARQVGQAQQSLSSDISTVESDSSTLNNDKSLAGDISAMKSDYGTEQKDWQAEQADSCSNASYDASTVSYDANSVNYDLNSLNYDIQSLQGNSGIAGIRSDISAVNSDVSTLQNLGASPAQDPSGALSVGKTAISNANAAIQWATQQGNSINSQAKQLSTTAQNWVNQHGC